MSDREPAASSPVSGIAVAPLIHPAAAAMDEREPGYDELIRPVESMMMRSIWRIVRQRESAEDALQDALAVIWRKRHEVARHPRPEALILRIALSGQGSSMTPAWRRRGI